MRGKRVLLTEAATRDPETAARGARSDPRSRDGRRQGLPRSGSLDNWSDSNLMSRAQIPGPTRADRVASWGARRPPRFRHQPRPLGIEARS